MKKIINKVKKNLIVLGKFLPIPIFYSFIMTKKERSLFDKKIKKSKFYLEFGMGGSTIRALHKSKAKIYSIDSSKDWISYMREYPLIRKMEQKRLFLFYVNIGSTKEWGFPAGNKNKKIFPNYSTNIFNTIEKKCIDTVLIDGRFRVACTLKTILECYSNTNLQILIHDFWNRKQYHIVLKYLSEVESSDTLGVFVIKKDINLDLVKKDYNNYKYIHD